jgi:hypothetical protein
MGACKGNLLISRYFKVDALITDAVHAEPVARDPNEKYGLAANQMN